MVAQLLSKEPNALIIVSFSVLNVLVLMTELMKAYFIGIMIHFDFWNSISIIRFLLCSVWSILLYLGQDNYYIGWFMAFFSFVQGFYSLKIFSCTRIYVRLVFHAILDAFPFIIIFIYSTLAVGFLHLIAQDDGENWFYMIWQAPYQLNLQEFTHQVKPLDYVYFVLASLLNVVIMLNLLIAVLGDSFDRIKNESIEIQSADMLENILEIEYLTYWNRDKNEKVFIHVCQDPRIESYENHWEGKIQAVTNCIKQFQEENTKNYLQIKDTLKELETIKRNLKVIEGKLPNK
jgi:hypothetical protein